MKLFVALFLPETPTQQDTWLHYATLSLSTIPTKRTKYSQAGPCDSGRNARSVTMDLRGEIRPLSGKTFSTTSEKSEPRRNLGFTQLVTPHLSSPVQLSLTPTGQPERTSLPHGTYRLKCN